jgi:chemotaxis protein methyltransferase CheR
MPEPDGVLALGAAESVVGITNTFKPWSERRGLYRPNIAPVIRKHRPWCRKPCAAAAR